jgi:multidrug resistance efflux pump
MAEQKQQQAEHPRQPEHPKAAKPVLGSAAESSNPVVHQLLAQRDIAERNGDEDAVKAATAALADLGVE